MANKVNMMNKAEENVHKESRVKSKDNNTGRGSDVGNERKADVKGAQEGGSRAEGMDSKPHLGGAVRELREQHPIAYNDLGPHHGRKEHIRHEAVGKVYK